MKHEICAGCIEQDLVRSGRTGRESSMCSQNCDFDGLESICELDSDLLSNLVGGWVGNSSANNLGQQNEALTLLLARSLQLKHSQKCVGLPSLIPCLA